jgi:capsular polysaccharide biosynthesis protein
MSPGLQRTARRVLGALPVKESARAALTRVRVRRLLDSLSTILPSPGGRRVVVLVPGNRLGDLAAWWPHLADDTVHLVIDRKIPLAQVPARAASVKVAVRPALIGPAIERRVGPVDLVIDLQWADANRIVTTWVSVSSALRDDGAYLIAPPDLRQDRIRSATMAAVAALDGRAPEPFDGRPVLAPAKVEPEVISLSLVLDGGAVLTKHQTRYRFLKDDGIEESIKREPDVSLTILDELAPTTLTGGALTSHESTAPVGGLPVEMPVPRMQLRHYEGRVEYFGQTLLVAGHSILPDSHRFYRRPKFVHPIQPLLSALPGRQDAVLIPLSRKPRPKLPGTYYLLDPQITGHFGHIMTEVVPRLWGWDRAKALYPELKTLTTVKPGRTAEPVLERLLTAYGIAPEDIVLVDHPVELESVITATGMWHNFAPHFAHPELPVVWDRIAAQLIDPSAPPPLTGPSAERLFLTRAPGSYRTCHNAAEVEAVFRAHGFEILRPEEYDLGAQAAIFRGAKVVAGFGGSAMFNLMYNHGLQHMIVLNQERFSARNEHLYASLLGADEDWFWSPPDEPWFHSNWTFDFERNGADLEAVLKAL